MMITKVSPPVIRDDRCDRCPAAAQLRVRVHCDGLLATGAVLSFTGQQD